MRNILVLEGIGESGCILPKQLIKDISDGNCILFTGAGCSLDAGLPRWKHLIEALLDETYNRVPPDENTKQELQKLLNEGKLLVVARYCRAKLREAGFIRFLREQLGNYNPENAETHKILSTIKFKAILTTNYDPLTEDFYSDEKHPVYTAKDFENSSLDVENITPIIKIHGSLERPESIILTSTDIRNAIFGNNNFRERLKELFRNSTVLFIGYSFDDPNISMLLQDLLTSQPIETRMHYAIMPNTNSIMNDYLLEDMNVFVLSFKTSWNSFEPLHKVLNDLVASLPPHAFKI